jgi:hypothetical protein
MVKKTNFAQRNTSTMTNTMPAATCLNPAGGQKDNGSEVACMLKAPRASSVFPDARPEGFSILEQQTDDD